MLNGNGSSSHSMDTAVDNSEYSPPDKASSSPRPGSSRRGSKSQKRRTGIEFSIIHVPVESALTSHGYFILLIAYISIIKKHYTLKSFKKGITDN